MARPLILLHPPSSSPKRLRERLLEPRRRDHYGKEDNKPEAALKERTWEISTLASGPSSLKPPPWLQLAELSGSQGATEPSTSGTEQVEKEEKANGLIVQHAALFCMCYISIKLFLIQTKTTVKTTFGL